MDGDFERYTETQLAPTLQKGVVVVFDNLPAHKRDDARWAGERHGAWLLFLPPYSPDFKPEECMNFFAADEYALEKRGNDLVIMNSDHAFGT